MDLQKAKKFNSKMGKPKVQNLAKGGMVRHIANRKYFDDGGIATNSTDPGTNTTGTASGGGGTNNNGIAGALGMGNSFQAGNANVQSGTNQQQLGTAYTGANNAINAQVGLANTLTPQTQAAVGNQNALASQELAMTQGQGPNPALAQLAQTTGTNVNNQAALMAGQRGAAANPGLMAREAAQQGAATQQQAVGQAATEEAQQQIAAQNNLTNLAANQISQAGQATGNLSQSQQNEQNILQGANTAYNNAGVGMQSNINNVNAQTAAANTAANTNLIGSIGSSIPGIGEALGSLGMEKGGEVGKDGEHLKIAEMNAHSMNHMKKLATGGPVQSNLGQQNFTPVNSSGAPEVQGTSNFGSQAEASANQNFSNNLNDLAGNTADAYNEGQYNSAVKSGENEIDNENDLAGAGGSTSSMKMEAMGGQIGSIIGDVAAVAPFLARGGNVRKGPFKSHVANYLFANGGESGKVPAMVSPGERYLKPQEVEMVKKGADPTKMGEIIPGKAKVKGDSLKNDIVPKTLDAGGVVVDRKHVGNPKRERNFVLKSVAKHMKKPGAK